MRPGMLKLCVLLLYFPFWPVSHAQSASHLDSSVMRSDADPCVDFYRYACGRFAEQNPRHPGQTYLFLNELQGQPTFELLARTLGQETRSGTGTPTEKALAAYYDSCMDRTSIDREDLRALASLRSKIEDATTPADFGRTLAALASVHTMPLFRVTPEADQRDTRRQILALSTPTLTLPSGGSYLRSADADQVLLKAYRLHVQQVLFLSGYSSKRAVAGAAQIQEIETGFARASVSATAARDPRNQYHITSVADLSALVPGIDWNVFFASAGVPTPKEINIVSPTSLKAVQQLLATKDRSALRAYLTLRLIESIPPILQPSRLAAENRLFGALIGSNAEGLSKAESCAIETYYARSDDMVRLFLARFAPETLKTDATPLVEEIEAQMKIDIQRAEWMSPGTREQALHKLSLIANNIAYSSLSDDYSAQPVLHQRALQNYLVAAEAKFRRRMSKIGGPTDRLAPSLGPLSDGAAYEPDRNEIELPAASLMPPSFDPKASPAENYARIGFTAGHEIVHGYDDEGRQYDGLGQLKHWWTKEDAAHFNDRAACFVSEYGSFAIDGTHHVNGSLTLGENIADNGGLHLALAAFLSAAAREGTDVNLADDGYTPLQRFFLSYAQSTCSSVDPQAERVQVETNPHTPDRFRANGVLRNTPEFGKAFSCSKGQPMMPVQTCRIW